MATYEVPEQFVGKSLSDIRKKSDTPWRADVLAALLGVSEKTPFAAGQSFNISSIDPKNSEHQFLQSSFAPGGTYAQQQADIKQKQMSEILQQGKTEAVGTLQAGKEPLKQRYDDIISSITQSKEQRLQESDIATAQEYGKRGIPLSSGVYNTAVQRGRVPIDVAFGETLSNVALNEQQAQNAIDSAIAQIQRATSQDEVSTALQIYQIAENAKQQGLSLAESARQFDENLAFQKSQQQQPTADPSSQFTTLGEGSTLFNLLTGQPIFTAPKTYKSSGVSGGGISGGGFDINKY